MIIYFSIIAGLVAFFDTLNPIKIKNKKKIFTLLIILLIFFDGLRWQMGVDWGSYFSFFKRELDGFNTIWLVGLNDIKKDTHNFSAAYTIYTYIFQLFTNNYSLYLFITSLIFYSIIFKSVMKLTSYNALAFFYLISCLPWYSGSLRQMLACAFLAFSIRYIFKRKLFKFLILNFIGLYFHASLIVNVPLYILYTFNTFFLILVFISAIIILLNIFLFYPLFDYLFLNILKVNFSFKGRLVDTGTLYLLSTEFFLGIARKILTFIGFLFFVHIRTKDTENNTKMRFLLFVISLTIIGYIVARGYIEHVDARLDIYFLIIYGSILIGLINKNEIKFENRFIFFAFILILVFIFIFRIDDFTLFSPYSSIFFNYDFVRDHHSIYVDFWK